MIRNKEQSSIQKSKQQESKRRLIPQRDAGGRRGVRSQNALIRYFQETGEELRKVSWPTREQAVRLTLIVLGATAVAAIFLGTLDFVFHQLAALIL